MTHVSIKDAHLLAATGAEWYVRLECIGGNRVSAFYEAGKDANGYFIRYGKIGTKGVRKAHADAAAVFTQIAKKQAKGYVEVPPSQTTRAQSTPQPKVRPSTVSGSALSSPKTLSDPTFDKAPEGRYDVVLMDGGERRKKISAIKAIRQATRWDLKDAKNAIEGPAGTQLGVALTRAETFKLRLALHESGYKSGWIMTEEFSVDLSDAGAVFGLVATVKREGDSWRGFDASGRSLMKIPESLII